VGPLRIGSEHPIALQTMTVSDTRDVKATVEEVLPLCPSSPLLLCPCALVRPLCEPRTDACVKRERAELVGLLEGGKARAFKHPDS
jgi:4-hydroxy-3-methylbut-2-en-1-yl diphosphate synthase IspG/GcpE